MKLRELLKLFVWESVNPFLLRRKKKKIYKFNPGFKGLNLGCGLGNPPGWLGVDGGFTHIFVKKAPKFISKLFFKRFAMSKNYSFKEYYSKLKSLDFIHHDLSYGIPFADYSYHHRMYNFKELAAVLAKVGFKEIKEMEYKKGNIPDLEVLDTRPGLYVEAVK